MLLIPTSSLQMLFHVKTESSGAVLLVESVVLL